jgi:hypothetical protein
VRTGAGDGRRTKPIFTGPSHLSRAFGKTGRWGPASPSPPTIGASCEELRLAGPPERGGRGRESLPFPLLPGYRPMHCLEGLLSGARTANRTRVHIHTLVSRAARAFRVPGRLEPGCGFDPNFNGDRRPRRTDKPLGCVVPSRRKRGRSTTPIIAEAQLASRTPNFSAPACMHPSAVAAIALGPSGACQRYQSPPQPMAPGGVAGRRLVVPSLFQQGVMGAFA